MIPISTAVKLRGDYWTLQLGVHDPRGHRNTAGDDPQAVEYRVARHFRYMRDNGHTMEQTIDCIQLIADVRHGLLK